ncbi:alanyl-tRNA editing protein [Bacillus sp. AK031]
MKEKLFYEDSYRVTFKTKIVRQQKDKDGKWFVQLEETAFYPAGGGQPADSGFLNDCKVQGVQEINGIIRHYIDRPLEEGHEIVGSIDWERRFDHMQQHAGQHILSASFSEGLSYETNSFHLGEDICTIDLNVETLSEAESHKAENLANEIILENRPIHTKWVAKEELTEYPMRKQPTVDENIRLVIIPNFDYNGCGGTHPSSTGEVGMIKILGWEKQRKNIRISFVCGRRVAIQLHQKNEVLKDLTKLLNAPPAEMKTALMTLIENGNKNEKLLEQARQTLLQYEAKNIAETCFEKNGLEIITHVFQNRSMSDLQKIARTILNEYHGIVLFVSENEDKLQYVVGTASSLEVNSKELIGFALEITNGKGGGNPAMAQGGGSAVITGEELVNRLLERI